MAGKHQKRALGWVSAIKSGAQMLVGKQLRRAVNNRAVKAVESFKKGGRVHATGLCHLHKNEVVLTASQAKSLKKVLK